MSKVTSHRRNNHCQPTQLNPEDKLIGKLAIPEPRSNVNDKGVEQPVKRSVSKPIQSVQKGKLIMITSTPKVHSRDSNASNKVMAIMETFSAQAQNIE
jgi:hypothetical protein